MKRSVLFGFLILCGVCLVATPLAAQPVIEACDATTVDVAPFETISTTIDVEDDAVTSIGFAEIGLNLSTTWVGALSNIAVESPSSTTVTLHTGAGGHSSDFNVIYSDVGDTNTGGVGVEGEGVSSAFDCAGCRMQTPTGSPSVLSDFIGEDPNGAWELTVANSDTFDTAQLRNWCVLVWDVGPVQRLTCTPDPDEVGVVTVSFVAGADYTSVEITNFSDEVTGGEVFDDFIEGDTYEFTVGPLPAPQIAEMEVVGLIDGTSSAAATCSLPVLADPLECLSGVEGDIGNEFAIYVGIVEFETEVEVTDVTVDLDITHPFINQLDVALAHPEGTVVMLMREVNPSTPEDVSAKFWQLGQEAGSVPYNTGEIIRPTGPGALSDFVGGTTHNEDGVGAWALTVAEAFDPGTVNSWTLCVYDVQPAFAPTSLLCETGDDLGTVAASAIAGANYTMVRWFVNGVLVEEVEFDPPLEGGVDGITYTTEPQPLPSLVTIQVQGFVGEGADQAPGPRLSCSQRVSLPSPTGMSCSSEPGDTEITATWSLPDELDAYDSYEVSIDGEFTETIDGAETSYTTDEGFAEDTAHVITIVGILDDPFAAADPVQCRSLVLGEADVQECDFEGFSAPFGSVSSTLSIVDTGTIEDMSVVMEGNAGFFGALSMTLEHEDTGHSLRLKDNRGDGEGLPEDYCMQWTDGGEPLGGSTDINGCLSVAPQGPGTFASEFISDVSSGDWTLTLQDDSFEFSLNTWCLRMDTCDTLPPTDLLVEVVENDVFLSWTNDSSSDYTSVVVYEDNVVLATLDPDEEEFTLEDAASGRYRFRVSGIDDTIECEASSFEELVGVGFSETCLFDESAFPAGLGLPVFLGLTPFESVVIGDVEVLLDWEVAFTSDSQFAVISPFGTRVVLHSQQGGDEPFNLIWSSREESDPAPNGFPYNCDLCIQNPSPGNLDDFSGEISDGTWDLEFSGFGGGPVNAACLAIYEGCGGVPPSDLIAEVDDTDVLLSWANNAEVVEYDGLRVERNGEVIADLEPDAESYVDINPLSGFYSYRVIAEVTDPDTEEACDAGSAPTPEVAKGVEVTCIEEPVSDIGSGTVATPLEVLDDPSPDDVRVVVDISHAFVPDLRLEVSNPDEDSVTLYTGEFGLNGVEVDMDVVFADSGISQPVEDYNFGGLVEPKGPGALDDFLVGSIIGTWDLDITGTSFEFGTLNEYCLQFLVGCPIERPIIDGCTLLDDNGLPPVLVEFSGVDTEVVEEIQIFRNGVLIDTISSDSTEYVDESIDGTGRQTYRVAAVDEDLDCVKPSLPCESPPIGRFSACDAPALSISGEQNLDLAELEFSYLDADGVPVEFEEDSDRLIGDVEVDMDLTTTFLGDVDFWVLSPDLTTVRLQDSNAGDATALDVTFSDSADSFLTAGNATCECLVKPQGPGTFADMSGEDPEGEWAVAFVSFAPSTLNEWCVGVFPDELPPGEPTGFEFLRGDADNSGAISAIPDGLRILNWGSGNASEPPCLAAADVDGSGSVSAIPDGLRLLNWGAGNALPPPAPFPECGLDPDDPTLEDVSCDTDGDGNNDGGAGCSTAPDA